MDKKTDEAQEEKETVDFSKPDFSFLPKARHSWKQEGYYLVCRTCDLEHGVYVGEHKIMVDVLTDGTPVLKSRTELGMA